MKNDLLSLLIMEQWKGNFTDFNLFEKFKFFTFLIKVKAYHLSILN